MSCTAQRMGTLRAACIVDQRGKEGGRSTGLHRKCTSRHSAWEHCALHA